MGDTFRSMRGKKGSGRSSGLGGMMGDLIKQVKAKKAAGEQPKRGTVEGQKKVSTGTTVGRKSRAQMERQAGARSGRGVG